MAAVSIIEDDVEKALGGFLQAVLPVGTPIVIGQINRVPEPTQSNFVIMTPLRRTRLATNISDYQDAKFNASIAGVQMSVTAIDIGAVVEGATVFGTGVAANTTIVSQLSGSLGGTGVYQVGLSQIAALQVMAAGLVGLMQKTQFEYQLDFHGPLSGDYAQIVSTVMRSEQGVDIFHDRNLGVTPLYADDPRQVAFVDGETQYEDRWILSAFMQADPVVLLPQQFADAATIELISVDVFEPPS